MRITKIGIPPGGDINQVLVKSSGTDYDVEWGTGSGTATPPGGLNTQVQFNDGGVFGGDSGFTYNKTTNRLTLGSLVLNDVVDPGVDTDKFLVLTSLGVVSYRNGASVLVDIGGVPTSRTLTINGTSYDLSANRTWSVGTVESVGITAGTGISVANSPITGSGSITVTNTAPDQTVSLTAGSNITITGTYPSFTIAGTGGGGISGSGTSGQVAYWNGTSSITGESNLFWDASNDRLGIGTATPVSTLDVSKSSNSGSGATFPRIQVENTLATQGDGSTTFNFSDIRIASGNSAVQMFLATSYAQGTWEPQGLISVSSNHPLIFRTNNTEQMRIDSSGRLLIGTTTSSTYKLDVNGTGRFSSSVTANGITSTNAANPLINLVATNSTGVPEIYLKRNTSTTVGYIGAGVNSDISNIGDYVGFWNSLATGGFVWKTNTTTKMMLDVTGNLGLGVTPSAWGSGRTALQIGNDNSYFVGSRNTVLANNAYNNGTNWIYLTSSVNAHVYAQLEGGNHAWYTAPSGTAGNAITFTQAMTLDASGNLGIGIASPTTKLHVNGNILIPADGRIYGNSSTVTGSRSFIDLYNSSTGDLQIQTGFSTAAIVFSTNQGSSIVKMTSNGDLIIGSGADTGESLQVQGDAKISTISNATIDTDRFLVSDSGVIKYRTGTELRSDIGAEPTLTKGNLTEATSSVLTITGGTGAVIGSGTSIEVKQASGSQSGYLSSTDWTTFNSKGTGTIGGSGTDGYIAKFSGGSATLGNSNIISVGSEATWFNTFNGSGSGGNIMIGHSASTITTGADNISLGRLSLDALTTGYNNVAIGTVTMSNLTTGYENIAVGELALGQGTSAYANTAIGYLALGRLTTGGNNTALGFGAGRYISGNTDNQTSVESIYIGKETQASANGNSYEIVIGNYVVGNGTNTATIGDSNTTTYTNKLNLTGGQLIFPATQNASTNVNTLDDYEEGVWTPTLLAETTNFTSVTYDSRTTGTYTKIGNTVFINGVMWTDAVNKGSGGGAASGSVGIGGLPFTTSATGGKKLLVNVADAFAWLADEPLSGASLDSSTRFILYKRATSNGATTPVVVADVNTTADDNIAYFQGFYSV